MVSERLVLEKEKNRELICQHVARYTFAKNYIAEKTVLDIACGSGYGTSMLADGGAKKVIGVDISNAAIDYAKGHFQRNNIFFIRGDALSFNANEKYDVVVSFETIEHLTEPEKFLKQVANLLVDEGVLIISTPIRERGMIHDQPRNCFHLQEWAEQEFLSMLRVQFQCVEMCYQFGFEKKWYPFSRTLNRATCRLLFPNYLREVDSFSVQKGPPLVGPFKLQSDYMIAVCRNKMV